MTACSCYGCLGYRELFRLQSIRCVPGLRNPDRTALVSTSASCIARGMQDRSPLILVTSSVDKSVERERMK